MEIIYIQLDYEAIASRLGDEEDKGQLGGERLPFDCEIPLPYIIREENELGADCEDFTGGTGELDWNALVDGILYIALYEPKHEHRSYYKDFLLSMEPELPYILQERLYNQYDEGLWSDAGSTVGLLLFLLPDANRPLLEMSYLYEQEAENALLEQRFTACSDAWNLAALSYKQLLERDEMDARCYYQMAYYYLQCWNFPAAYQAFISSQQLALSPENPLWAKCHKWLQRMILFDFEDTNSEDAKAMGLSWVQILDDLQRALREGQNWTAETLEEGEDLTSGVTENLGSVGEEVEAMGRKGLWLAPLSGIDQLLQAHPDSGMLWFLRGFCLLFGHDLASLRSLADAAWAWATGGIGDALTRDALMPGGQSCRGRGASHALNKAVELGWDCPLGWQLPYYLGLSYYLEGEYREAEKSFLQVLQIDTEHCATLYWLEKLYSDREDEQSLQYQELLAVLQPQFPELIEHFV